MEIGTLVHSVEFELIDSTAARTFKRKLRCPTAVSGQIEILPSSVVTARPARRLVPPRANPGGFSGAPRAEKKYRPEWFW